MLHGHFTWCEKYLLSVYCRQIKTAFYKQLVVHFNYLHVFIHVNSLFLSGISEDNVIISENENPHINVCMLSPMIFAIFEYQYQEG